MSIVDCKLDYIGLNGKFVSFLRSIWTFILHDTINQDIRQIFNDSLSSQYNAI